MTRRRIGILGGTFDPIHCGHLDAGAAADRALHLTELWFVPSQIPPHRAEPAASSYHRFAMVALAIVGRPHWRASDLELRHAEPSFTSATLDRLHAAGYAAAELFFIVGADAFADIATWRDYPSIIDRAHFAVVSRPGLASTELIRRLPSLAERMTDPSDVMHLALTPAIFLIDAPTADVSSTAVRSRRATGQPIAGLVPPAVQQHIEQHGLYANAGSDADEVARRDTRADNPHGQS
jgi:nicotinate-nucleotide adenylyltransferase